MLERGHEYGTTTGRQRRCGWLDLVALRYAARINGLTALAITKLDVLSGIDPLQVCTRYRHGEGAVFDDFPYHQSILHSAEASTRSCPGSRTTSASAARSPTSRRPRATTSRSWPTSSASRSSSSASAPAATR